MLYQVRINSYNSLPPCNLLSSLLPPASCLLPPPTSYLLPPASCLLPNLSQLNDNNLGIDLTQTRTNLST
ncbi:MAG: hypothetical protein F6K47_42125 [Symploca sp. SIO2E6]|nr:hypothetical protein [Symploca sp. SIO2E6]